MNYKLIFFVTVVSFLRYSVIGTPLTSDIFKGIFKNVSNHISEIVEVVSNELPNIQDAPFENPELIETYLRSIVFFLLTLRWPDVEVPIEFDAHFTTQKLNFTISSLNACLEKTCIRFKLRTGEVDYITITVPNTGCWTLSGRLGGKLLRNFPTSDCLTKPGIAQDQNRTERDSSEYKKQPIDGEISQQCELSELDIEKFIRMYNCKVNSTIQEPSVGFIDINPL